MPGSAQFIAYRTQPFPDRVEHLGDQAILGQSNWQYPPLNGRDNRRWRGGYSPIGARRRASRRLRDRGKRLFELSPLRFVLEDRQGVFLLARA